MGFKCGKCLKDCGKSYLKWQAHMAQEHGEKNKLSKWTGDYNQKEATTAAEEKLKREITKYNFYNTDRKKH